MYLKDFLKFIEENKNSIHLDTCKLSFPFDIKKYCILREGNIIFKSELNIPDILDCIEDDVDKLRKLLNE